MIPQELRDLDQWVCAKNGSKCPFKAWTPEPAASSDPSTWCDYATADYSVLCGHYDQVGFVFHDNGLVGIDIDCGWDEDGLLSPVATDILLACGSYTEHSRSGRGFHVIVRGNLPFSGKNNQRGVEIYRTGRYFIMTGKTAVYDQIVENQSGIDYVVEKYFQDQDRERASSGDIDLPFPRSRVYNPKWELPEKGRVKLRPVYPRIPKGSRNLCLTSLAGMLHNMGYSKSQIYDEIQYANTTACDPCLDKRELRSIVNSVSRYKR